MSNEDALNSDSLLLSGRAQVFFSAMEAIAGFDLPRDTLERFRELHAAVTRDPRPGQLQRLSREGGSRIDWFARFISSTLGSVQEGIAASHYHLANVEDLETRMIHTALSFIKELQLRRSHAIAGGNTRRLTFEYQAFVFALRRTLEYFAVSVGAFFKSDVHRIRGLAEAIRGREPEVLSAAVCDLLAEAITELEQILPTGKHVKRSVRDLLAHWEAVSAGCFNVTRAQDRVQVGLFGGGEQLQLSESAKKVLLTVQDIEGVGFLTLTPTLRNEMAMVENLVFRTYSTLGLLSGAPSRNGSFNPDEQKPHAG